MKRLFTILAGSLILTACADETLTAYGAEGQEFVLVDMNGQPFAASATISFPEPGRGDGQGPCNYYFGAQTAPYPWFSIDGVGSTLMACEQLDLEIAYFDMLQAMSISEVSGDTLILSNDAGQRMVFEAS
jgi:heat shock protein HslJ